MTQPILTNEQFVFALEAAPTGMVLINASGCIVRVNQHVERIFGFTRSELEGGPVERIVPMDMRASHAALRTRYVAEPEVRLMGRGRELMGQRKDGSLVALEVGLNPLYTPEGLYVLGSVVDITERKRAESSLRLEAINRELEEQVRVRTARLSAMLAESDALLREVHHRVKNNLQILFSLINMQRRRFISEAAAEPLEQCQARVAAIALVYDRLNTSRDHARVPFGAYARSLSNNLLDMLDSAAPANVSIDYAIDDVALGLDQAIPSGLILNELVMNALKHAFVGGRSGRLLISLSQPKPGRLLLKVQDDGVGLPAVLDVEKPSTLGLQLVRMLAEQLQAELHIERTEGTTIELELPAP